MNKKTLTIISIVMLSLLLSACDDKSSKESKQTQTETTTDDEVGVLEPYLEEPVLETHKNGERKVGLYSESNGQGSFQDCKTGKEYIIDIRKDASQLHSNYISLSQEGQRLMIELIGEIKKGKDDSETLQPQTLLGVIHKETCN